MQGGLHDFDHENYDEKESTIPADLDGWHWAFSDSESDGEETTCKVVDKEVHQGEAKGHGDAAGAHKLRVAETREEYLELKEAGLLLKPDGSTLGVHPAGCVWRGSYPGSKHYGRTWGPHRSPKKALLEVLMLIIQDHVNLHPKDTIAKGQLARVTKAWKEA